MERKVQQEAPSAEGGWVPDHLTPKVQPEWQKHRPLQSSCNPEHHLIRRIQQLLAV